MKNNFRLSEKQVDKLMAKLREERAKSISATDGNSYSAFSRGIELLHEAQMSAFAERANKPRKLPLDLQPCKD